MAGDDTQVTAADGLDSPQSAAKWLDVIARYDRAFFKWRERVRRILKVYTDNRSGEEAGDLLMNRRKLNIYWANVKTLQPAIYQKLPMPAVSRRFKDDDRVARVASEMIERAVGYEFDRENFDTTMRAVRDDFIHAARGQVWIRYKPEIDANEQIVDEYVPIDYVNWADFGHNVARTWAEVTAVWRRTYLTRKQLVDRFGAEKGNAVGLDHKPDEPTDNQSGDTTVPREDKATVYEIWDKVTRKVWFIAKSYPKPLEVIDPFLVFEEFFPCPRPAYGTLESQTLIPVPDYALYQDQLEEIDELTIRMGKLLDALKLVGFYPSSSEEGSAAIEKALKPGVENVMIPVPTWGAFKDGGGAAGNIEWLPVEQVVTVLKACWEARKQLIDDVYQVTGISDIVRGDSDANETATAQRIKSQWGSIRIRDQQFELARFARDVARLVAEVICDRFQPQTLMAMTNMHLPTDAEVQAMMAQAMASAAPPAALPPAGAPNGGPPSGEPQPAGGPPPGPQGVAA